MDRRSVKSIFVWGVALAFGAGCAEARCGRPTDAGEPVVGIDASRRDAGPCPSGEGLLVLGPVVTGAGCAAFGGYPLDYWVFDEARVPVRWGPADCGGDGTDFIVAGSVPAGRYFVAAEAARGLSLAGGELLYPAACAETAVTMPWLTPGCSRIEVDVPACGTAVVPVLLYSGLRN